MTQLSLFNPPRVYLDGVYDHKGVKYLDWAEFIRDDLYKCLAIVNECLCIVEVRITCLI